MDKKFVMGIAAMAALTLVSCSSDDLDSFSDNSSKNEAISFDGYLGRSAVAVNGTRGSEETANTLKTNGFGVFGKYNAGAGQTSNPDFFKNQKVTYSNKKWTYSPLKYWPTNGQIDFLAYAPYDSEQKLIENSKLAFEVKPTATEQKDLLWANATGQITDKFEDTTKKKVKFQFHHALSRLGYTVKLSGDYSSNATFTLKKITLAGSPDETTKAFYKNGTIDLAKTDTKENLSKTNDPKGLWTAETTADNKQNFPWVSSDKQVDNTGIKNAETDYLFVIPQDFSQDKTTENPNVDELYVIVQYTIKYNGGGEQTNTVYKRLKQNFLQGKAYMLNLTIGLPIEFDVDVDTVNGVDPWEDVNDGKGDIDSWDDIEHK